ncbi:T7SS effector LXG polymorphic toxin [Streptococcus sp. 27098_8_73]|uniref:T7SS effector LXG polymorphic toxin n=1 Tax=Streptococcus sp. 27098_8_73 TaxID=3003668 RepID=UPI00352ECC47
MKIDLSEVQAQKSALSTSVGSIKGDLTKARSSLSQVVSTNSLKGVVKDTINQKVSNYQIPLLDNYTNALDSIVNRYDGIIKLFKETVGETNDSAIINTEYLERVKQRMKDPIEGLSKISTRTQSIYSDISDIISLSNPSLDDVNTTYAKAQKSLDDTIKNMETFNNVILKTDTFDLIDMQDGQLKTLSSYSSVSYTNQTARTFYRGESFKNSVEEIHTALHSNSRSKVNYQNKLAKQLAESKYSGTVASNYQNYSDVISNDLKNNFASESIMSSIDVFGDKGWVKLLEKAPTVVGGLINGLYKLSDSLGSFINLGTNGIVPPNIFDNVSNVASGSFISIGKGIESVAKSGPEIGQAMTFIGPAIDFTAQVSAGENVPNAVVKTGIHTAVSGLAVKSGMAIGTAIMPGVGTVVGFLAGVAVGIVANSAIDMAYDNSIGKVVTENTNNVIKAGKEVIGGVGNAVSDFFSGLGTAFQ